MRDFALLLKSYGEDFAYSQRLVESFHRYNVEDLHLYIVVPSGDLAAFAEFAADDVTILPESLLDQHLVNREVLGVRPGYINQEIVKLSFWELGLAANYFSVDSDAVFIRDLHESDFMADAQTPYTVLVEDNELKVEPRYFDEHWQGRETQIRRIQKLVGLDEPIMRTCHGHQVLSATVLRSFKQDFLEPRGWSYADALEAAPYEFSWYTMWLQKAQPIAIHAREPLVKVFHHEGQHLEYILRGVTVADIARGYLAVVINSNYSRDLGVVRIEATKPESLARYLSYGEVGQLITNKLKDTYRRRYQR